VESGQAEIIDYSGYRRSDESNCFLTNCPKCGRDVYFVRHNGGSVWIDPPLGPPWDKHPCLDDRTPSKVGDNLILSAYGFPKEISTDAILAVAKETETSFFDQSTLVRLDTGADKHFLLLVRNNAGFLAGNLILYEPQNRLLSIFGDSSKSFFVVAQLNPLLCGSDLSKTVVCPECQSRVKRGKLESHMAQHFLSGNLVSV